MSVQGNFFEDFYIGQKIEHAVSRTVTEGDRSLYIALYGDRQPLFCNQQLARKLGLPGAPLHDLLVFHIIFGKTVPDISLNAVANLGYAEVLFSQFVYPGDTLSARSEIIGKRESSSLKNGIVWVKTEGFNQKGEVVLSFYRWVMVHKKSTQSTGEKEVPKLPEVADPTKVGTAQRLQTASELSRETGSELFFEDLKEGDVIHHMDGQTIEEADHMLATRLYQNLSRVHFNAHKMQSSRFGKRLVYGGHIISLARALSVNGLSSGLFVLGINSGTHANPTFAGDTIYAYSKIIEKKPLSTSGGAVRIQLVAVKNEDPSQKEIPLKVEEEGKEKYHPAVVLDLDLWLYVPKK